MKRSHGFSLIELLTVVAIIGIIAAFAMPAYRDYVIRGKLVEAFSSLGDLRVRLEQYYQDNRNYGSTAAICGVALPQAKYFTISCNWGVGATNQSYTATATGIANEGMTGFAYTITETNAKASNITAAGWSNPATNNCWARAKNGVC